MEKIVEQGLHLVERFMKVKENVSQIEKLSENMEITREELAEKVRVLSRQILEEL